MTAPLDQRAGFRRRIRIEPTPSAVTAEVEDDYHCMGVRVAHDGQTATKVEAVMERIPWSTCPGAAARLVETFQGVELDKFKARGEQKTNCTHLHDMAVLAAAHARDDKPTTYDILVSDVDEEGRRDAEIRRNGEKLIAWSHVNFKFVAPEDLKGQSLYEIGDWIKAQTPDVREAARIFRWATMIANGRAMTKERMYDAAGFANGQCYTFQPERAAEAKRVGKIIDFSAEREGPLDDPAHWPVKTKT